MTVTDPANLNGNPDLFIRIAENALTVADELREDYFKSTLGLARSMRDEFRRGEGTYRISRIPLDEQTPCAVAFVDGGLSKIDVGLGVPLIVRAGIFRVKQGERDLEKRETFDHFPLMLGQLRGGLKASSKYGDVVRELVELGALVTALEDERFSDIRVLMLHGPLQFVSGPFFEHWFYPEDYEQMLGMSDDRPHVQEVLGAFAGWCEACVHRETGRCSQDLEDQHLPAVCMMAFLQEYVFRRAAENGVLLCGVVERSFGRSITKYVVKRMLDREPEVFGSLLESLAIDSKAAGVQADAILDATRYNDAVLLALALDRGEQLDWYPVEPTSRIRDERAALFPHVQTTFVRTTSAKYPMRIEVPASYVSADLDEIVCRSFEYANLLPNYAFPIGLDIVDKYAAIPGWMTKAYRQLILAQYGRLLAGEYVDMTDVERLQMMVLTQGQGGRKRTDRPGV
ncbi:MAG: DNA double-strand break repair nuclease NurA [Coriobacteriia bacterium]|nr:DNA double-strand break repair nuclease NurA [Coriobacteriia bacterium]